MTSRIEYVSASEILDSRGNPTLKVAVVLTGGISAVAAVPSGASTGEHEALELRDHDPKRFLGKGVLRAAANVNDRIAPALRGQDPFDQASIDRRMIELDGTEAKKSLGANAILGVSMAVARVAALSRGQALFEYLGGSDANRLPMPMMNVLNGGKHADNSVDFQEFMIVPVGAQSFATGLRLCAETYQALKSFLHKKGYSTAVGDEGGFAPNLQSNESACKLIVAAVEAAGYAPGKDIAIALDPAATSFFANGVYDLERSGQGRRTSDEMTDMYERWTAEYPIISLEDGLAETDWSGFRAQTARLGSRLQIVGDDIFVTNPKFIRRGIAERTANAVLIKLNQIGTVTETIEAIDLCREAGWGFVISHRSGETEDTFIADFAVAMGGGQIKSGAPCRSERVAKYNRLLEIERQLGPNANFSSPYGPR